MIQSSIFLPALALMGWTLAVLLLIPFQRFKAVFAGQVTACDFRHGESANVPAAVSLPNRAFMNLLEMPVLFYMLSIVSYVTQIVTPNTVMLAWVYFGLRVAHSVIFLTYNDVFHRFLAFAISNVVLLFMWIGVLLNLPR